MELTDYPVRFFALCSVVLWFSAQAAAYFRRKRDNLSDAAREDLGVVLGATLTLLGLVIGFSFSMATGRYDQRKNYEEEEANAIGTEYVRAGLLPAADAARARALLRSYLDQRILFYTARDSARLDEISASTGQLQEDLWSAVEAASVAQPTPVVALAISGMNDVLNRQGYTQAAWWNRIPISAWVLLSAIAVCGNVLFGYYARLPQRNNWGFFVLPLMVAVSFLLIADLDSPRGGLIRVSPRNLTSLRDSIRAH